jgi:K+-sensing histidine kinase KdpD
LALRNLVDAAYRLSPPHSPIQVLMTQQGYDVQVGVRHTSIAAGQLDAALSMAHDGLGVSRLVAKMIIASHGGTLRDEAAGAATTAWVRLPVLE